MTPEDAIKKLKTVERDCRAAINSLSSGSPEYLNQDHGIDALAVACSLIEMVHDGPIEGPPLPGE